MPKTCAVPDCKNRFAKGSNITFHKFPFSDLNLVKEWLSLLHMEDYAPGKYATVCSAHFSPDCFEKNRANRTLKKGSVPTILNPVHHSKKKFIHTSPAKRDKSNSNTKKIKMQVLATQAKKDATQYVLKKHKIVDGVKKYSYKKHFSEKALIKHSALISALTTLSQFLASNQSTTRNHFMALETLEALAMTCEVHKKTMKKYFKLSMQKTN